MSRLIANTLGRFLQPVQRISAQIRESGLIVADTIANTGFGAGSGSSSGIWMSLTYDNLDLVTNDDVVLLENVDIVRLEGLVYNYEYDQTDVIEQDIYGGGGVAVIFDNGVNSTVVMGINAQRQLYLRETHDSSGMSTYRITMALLPDPHPNGYSVSITGPQGDAGPQGIQGIQGIQGPQGDTGPAGTITKSAWQTVSGYSAGWQDFFGDPVVYRTLDDFIQIKGRFENTGGPIQINSNTTIFQLPVAYRPQLIHHFAIASGSAFASCQVDLAGYFIVRFTTAQSSWFAINVNLYNYIPEDE